MEVIIKIAHSFISYFLTACHNGIMYVIVFTVMYLMLFVCTYLVLQSAEHFQMQIK